MPPPDPVLLENTIDWLKRAREDLGTAEFTLAAPDAFIRSSLFHSQQAVEKAMKALLTWHDVPFRATHNLVELGDACAAVDTGLMPAVDAAVALTKYATRFRYPGAPYEPEMKEAEEALRVAKSFLAALCARLPADVVSGAGLPGAFPPSSR